jgi:VanZ family protein
MRAKVALIIGCTLATVITVLSLVPPWLRPETGMPHDIEHFGIFFATGLAFGVGYYRRPFVTLVVLVAFAGLIELAQILVPSRHAELSDFVVDAFALCVGVVIACFLATETAKLKKT